MKNDAAWCRAMGRTLLRMAEAPTRRSSDEIHTSLRSIAFQLAAMALVLEDEDRERAFVTEQPTQPEGLTAP